MPTAQLTDRAVLLVGDTEARPFLQGLLTNDVDRLAPGRPQWAALLSPQGKALFDMILFHGEDGGVLIDAEAARVDELARRLTMYRLRRAVTVARTGHRVFATWDEAGGGPEDPRLAALGTRSIGTGTADIDVAAFRKRRRRLGVPEGAAELGVGTTLWLEANAAELNGVSFTKGCYVGQENTARMHHRDKVRRRLLPIALDAPPGEAGTIMAGERAAGELRTFENGVGMAYLRMEYAGDALTVGGARAGVIWPGWLPGDGLRGGDGKIVSAASI